MSNPNLFFKTHNCFEWMQLSYVYYMFNHDILFNYEVLISVSSIGSQLKRIADGNVVQVKRAGREGFQWGWHLITSLQSGLAIVYHLGHHSWFLQSAILQRKKNVIISDVAAFLFAMLRVQKAKIVAHNVGSGGRLEILEMCLGWILSSYHGINIVIL